MYENKQERKKERTILSCNIKGENKMTVNTYFNQKIIFKMNYFLSPFLLVLLWDSGYK